MAYLVNPATANPNVIPQLQAGIDQAMPQQQGWNPFAGFMGGNSGNSAVPSIYDVQQKQALAKQLLGNQIPAQNALGVIADALAGAAGGSLNKQAAQEQQQGADAARKALANALIGGPQSAYADPSALVDAVSNPFLPQAGAQMASDIYQNQAGLMKPQYETGGYSGAPPGIFTAGAPAGQQFQPLADTQSTWDSTVSGVENHLIPPTAISGLSRAGQAYALSKFARDGFDLSTAALDYGGARSKETAINGVRGTAFARALDAAAPLLDNIDRLADQWNSTVPTPLNAFNLEQAKKGFYGQDKAQLATQLESQISDIAADLGQIYKGGNSPTDKALEQGATQLSSAWSTQTIHAMTNQIRQNIGQRAMAQQQASQGMGLSGGANIYAPGPQQSSQPSQVQDFSTYSGGE